MWFKESSDARWSYHTPFQSVCHSDILGIAKYCMRIILPTISVCQSHGISSVSLVVKDV